MEIPIDRMCVKRVLLSVNQSTHLCQEGQGVVIKNRVNRAQGVVKVHGCIEVRARVGVVVATVVVAAVMVIVVVVAVVVVMVMKNVGWITC